MNKKLSLLAATLLLTVSVSSLGVYARGSTVSPLQTITSTTTVTTVITSTVTNLYTITQTVFGEFVTTQYTSSTSTVTSSISSTGITCVQGYTGCTTATGSHGTANSASSITITMALAPTTGDVLVCTIGTEGTTASETVSSITESGVTWASTADVARTGSSRTDAEVWHGSVGVSASTTIAINLSGGLGASGQGIANCAEYSGLSTTKDQTTTNAQTSNNAPNTGTTSTTVANELWVASILTQAGAKACGQSSPTNGFTLVDGVDYSSGGHAANGYLAKIVSSTGTASTGDSTGSCYSAWAAGIVAYEAAS